MLTAHVQAKVAYVPELCGAGRIARGQICVRRVDLHDDTRRWRMSDELRGETFGHYLPEAHPSVATARDQNGVLAIRATVEESQTSDRICIIVLEESRRSFLTKAQHFTTS